MQYDNYKESDAFLCMGSSTQCVLSLILEWLYMLYALVGGGGGGVEYAWLWKFNI